jgi:ankyrin repeat protein
MDLSQAIANLLKQEGDAEPKRSTWNELLGDLLQRIAGNQFDQLAKMPESQEIFEQLAEMARSGRQDFFNELVKAEQQYASGDQPSLLMAAVMANRVEVVKALLVAGADVHAKIKQFFEFNALDFAVRNSNLEMAKVLLEGGADPNWINHSPGSTPIIKAIKNNHIEWVSLLLKYGASVVFTTGFKPLVEATQQGSPEMIRLLLGAGCPVNDRDYSGTSALRNACIYCNVEVIKTLLDSGAEFDPFGADFLAIFGAPFFMRQISGLMGEQPDPTARIPQAIHAFIDAGANVDVQGQDGTTALTLAVSEGYLDVVKMLLEAGANPNLKGKLSAMMFFQNSDRHSFLRQYAQPTTALNLAAAFGHTNIAQVLIEYGSDLNLVDEQGRDALAIATKEGHQEIVRLLSKSCSLSEVATISTDALLGAAKQGNLETLRSALAAGIDPNTSEAFVGRNRRDKTALMFAAEAGHLECVQILLAQGADVNLSDRPGKKLGKTPLMYAAQHHHGEITHLLLVAGALVNVQDKRGETALLYAVQEKADRAVEHLLSFGANIHQKSWEGTPFEAATYAGDRIARLMTAADRENPTANSLTAAEEMLRAATFSGNVELVRDLIQQGVNVNAAEHNGWTALMYSAATGQMTIVQLLLAAGADVNLESTSGQTALSEARYWKHTEVADLLVSAGAIACS